MTPVISIIVAVYKAESCLRRCVDSLLAQTFQDYEILLVDDGSPDRSGEICDEYARKDNRVRVFHKKDTPSPIIWLGTTRELFNLIWEYYEGSTKIWEKTRKFFHDINGIPPKINGAKNQAISPSARMQRIFDSLK